MWQQFREHHGNDSREKLLKRISREVEKRGVVDVLRGGIKESGCHFDLAYFQRERVNPETQKLHAANMFSVVRQLYYSKDGEAEHRSSLVPDGLRSLPPAKEPLNGQNVLDAIRQYKNDRSPKSRSSVSAVASRISRSIPIWFT